MQVCVSCHGDQLEQLRAKVGFLVFAAKVCRTCGIIWSRDQMASRHMMHIGQEMVYQRQPCQ